MDNQADSLLRLQAYLARGGIASRRASEALILSGRVRVNGSLVTELGTKVSKNDEVTFDGKRVVLEECRHYLALNKPAGYICASKDPQGRRLALSLLDASLTERLYNVGRLDYRSSGLILFTNDGEFAKDIAHPSAMIEKEYLVEATGQIPDVLLSEFLGGIEIDGEKYQCKAIERVGRKALRITLIEGKNREIRRVFSHFHLHPETLHRVRIGPILLGTLESGLSRELSAQELEGLRKLVHTTKGETAW